MYDLLQVCAANFGEFCSIVGQEATEKLLVRCSTTLKEKCKTSIFFYNVNSVENSGEILVHPILCVCSQCCHETSLYIMSFALGKSLIYGFVSIIDAQVF